TYDAALTLAQKGGIDALFLSCTNLRTLDVIAKLETETGLPVLSSNQVLAWDLARRAEVTLPDNDFGQLFRVK
ncbi:MAG: Asp/Glu racemase, partial [Loktanella sp.]|nr:Asp/Glu racemase [Loktanella sp.]